MNNVDPNMEGQWAWRAGKPLDDCPYDLETEGHKYNQWCLGWMNLDELHASLDLTSDLAGISSPLLSLGLRTVAREC